MSDDLHHDKKTPFPLTVEALQPTKSKDEIYIQPDYEQTQRRSAQAGRAIHCYFAKNLSNAHEYDVELLEDVNGQPHGWCNCAASVVCKHIKTALARLREDYPEFGASVFPKRATLQEAAEAALKTLTGSEREYALVDVNRPNYTICDMLREALGQPPQDRSDW